MKLITKYLSFQGSQKDSERMANRFLKGCQKNKSTNLSFCHPFAIRLLPFSDDPILLLFFCHPCLLSVCYPSANPFATQCFCYSFAIHLLTVRCPFATPFFCYPFATRLLSVYYLFAIRLLILLLPHPSAIRLLSHPSAILLPSGQDFQRVLQSARYFLEISF